MGLTLDHIHGTTFHKRHGAIANAFSYGVDYMLVDLDGPVARPFLMSQDKFNLISMYWRDHGGLRGAGQGLDWARQTLRDNGFAEYVNAKILLLAQPRVFGHVFNPVSFWLVFDENDKLRIAIAEVNNTFGDRHSYLCHHDDLRPILKGDQVTARKVFHVSPFQDVSGEYTFKFDVTPEKLGVWIDYRDGNRGVYATFVGKRQPVTNVSILRATIMRPFGSIRVLALIYYQALKLKLKGAIYRVRPLPPKSEVSR